MKAEYLVTGGAGFIGSNIVRSLVEAGASVRVLDNLATGNLDNIRDLGERIDFQEGDIRKPSDARRATKGVRFLLHLAALPSVVQSVDDPALSHEANATGAVNMLIAARDNGVERFVFSSSCAVYGDAPELPKREDMLPAPLSPYAVQKLAGEYYCRVFHSLYGLRTYVLRYFNVFGPRQNPRSQYAAVIPLFIEALNSGAAPVIHGAGEQTRDFVYVEDVARANLACCTAPDGAAGQVYNIARGQSLSIRSLAEKLLDLMQKAVRPNHVAARAGDVPHSRADTSKAKSLLGWNAEVPPDEGFRRTIKWFARA